MPEMQLVAEAAKADATIGGYSEDGPDGSDLPYTIGKKVYTLCDL